MEEMMSKRALKEVTVNTEQTNQHACPHCGELYIELRLPAAGETLRHLCDSEDGCGKYYRVIYK
jgi:predicted RNA-binding Zn-ribbon protein involved in translation (DUF1610 family)